MRSKKILVVLLLVMLLSTIPIFAEQNAVKNMKDEYFRLANEASKKGDFSTSLKFIKQAYELDPNDYFVASIIAFDYMMIGESLKGIDFLEGIIPQIPEEEIRDHPFVFIILANLYYSIGDIEKAVLYYSKIMKYDSPTDNEHNKLKEKYFILSLLAKQNIDFSTSLEYLTKAYQLDPDDYLIMAHLANDYRLNGNGAKALEMLEEALPKFPKEEIKNHLNFYQCLADLYYIKNEYEKSEECYKKILEIDPEYANINLEYAEFLTEMNRKKESIPYFEKALDLDPDNKEILESLELNLLEIGEEYYFNGDDNEAKKYLLKAFMLNPSHNWTNYLLGDIYYCEDDYKNAIKHLTKYKNKENKDVILSLGISYYMMKDYNTALTYLEKYLEIDKKDKYGIHKKVQSLISDIKNILSSD